jgi:fido (protein-threonine AMPylation protein)
VLRCVEDLLERFAEGERGEVLAIAEAAGIAARETFGPFRDEEDSPFYEAEDLDPQLTWERIAERVADATACAVAAALLKMALTSEFVCDVHRHIFGEFFPSVAGRMRAPSEGGQYSIVLGRQKDEWMHRPQVGTSGKRLPGRVREICAQFNGSVEYAFSKDEPEFRTDLVLPAVRAYARLLGAHPFIDGNGRSCYVVLQFALVRIGLLTVALDDFEAHQVALGAAIRRDGKRSYLQLETLVSDTILDAAV